MRRAESPSVPNALGGHEARIRSIERRPPFQNYPMKQQVSLAALFDFGDVDTPLGTVSVVLDPLVYTNHYLQTTGQNATITFMFAIGPRYSMHEVILTRLEGPDFGTIKPYIAKLTEDIEAPDDAGFINPRELIQNWNGAQPINWLALPNFNQAGYAAALTRNLSGGIFFRLMGGVDDYPTVAFTDDDGYSAIDGGPGIYAMQLLCDTKHVLSTGYKMGFSEISVNRIREDGFL